MGFLLKSPVEAVEEEVVVAAVVVEEEEAAEEVVNLLRIRHRTIRLDLEANFGIESLKSCKNLNFRVKIYYLIKLKVQH
jgi:hypothetical protein